MGRHKEYVREEVLTKARDLFWAKGYEGTHLQELVEVTGVSRFGLYSEFGGKEGLFQEALENYIAEAKSAYDDTLAREPRGLNNIHDYFDSIRITRSYHGCFLVNTLTEKHIVTETAFKTARRTTQRAERLFLENLQAAADSGELSPDHDPVATAKLLTALDQGLAIYGIVSPSNTHKDAIVAQLKTLLS
jgi:AcrR family transcriptional regulator